MIEQEMKCIKEFIDKETKIDLKNIQEILSAKSTHSSLIEDETTENREFESTLELIDAQILSELEKFPIVLAN